MRRAGSREAWRAGDLVKALVTGGDGFIGQHLIALLLTRGHDTCGTSLAESPAPGSLSPEERRAVQWHGVDVRDRDGLARVVEACRPDTIFHLAGYSSSTEARTRAVDALRVNGEGTLHLLETVSKAGPDHLRIVVAGSADAYGRGERGLIDERTPLRPESLYGAVKAAQDVLARGAGRALGLDVRVARLFPLVGPGQRDAFVLPSFCRRALAITRGEGAAILRVGNLDAVRDFTDVRDGVDALAGLGELDAPEYRTFNVASGSGTSVGQLLEWVLEAAEIDPEIIRDPSLVRDGEPERVIGDPSRLMAATGWRVERDLRNCTHDTFQWMADSSRR